MKKLLTLAALFGAASLTFGQGIVSFTSGTVFMTTNTVQGGPSTGRVSGAGNYTFALFVAPTTQASIDATFTGWTFTGNYGTNIAAAGRFSGNYTTDPGVVVNGYGPGSFGNFVIAGWSSNIGSTWAQAQAWWNNGVPAGGGFFGFSTVAANVLVGGGSTPVPTLMGTIAGTQANTFNLGFYPAIPEPGTLALAGLGVAAMLIMRRRK